VPWCETCDRFWNPNTLNADGTCPSCGRQVAEPTGPAPAVEGRDRAPWHFKLLVVAVVAYLGWRLVQGLVWVAHHL